MKALIWNHHRGQYPLTGLSPTATKLEGLSTISSEGRRPKNRQTSHSIHLQEPIWWCLEEHVRRLPSIVCFILGCSLLFYQTQIGVKIKIIYASNFSRAIFNTAEWSSKTQELLKYTSLSSNKTVYLVFGLKGRFYHLRLTYLNLPSLTEIIFTS